MEPNFSPFGIPEVKPCIQCHPENQRESQVCVPATAVIKRPSLKAMDVTRITIAGNLPQGTFTQSIDLTLYSCQNIRETVFPEHGSWYTSQSSQFMSFSRALHHDVLIYARDLVSCFTKKKLAYLKHSWKPHSS